MVHSFNLLFLPASKSVFFFLFQAKNQLKEDLERYVTFFVKRVFEKLPFICVKCQFFWKKLRDTNCTF